MALLDHLLILAVLLGIGLACPFAVQWAIAVIRLPFGRTSTWRRVCARLVQGQGRPEADTLDAVCQAVRIPHAWRVAAAAGLVRSGTALVDALDRAGVLPANRRELARAAWAAGPGAWTGFLAGEARDAGPPEALRRQVLIFALQAALVLVVYAVIALLALQRIAFMLHNMDLPMPPLLSIVEQVAFVIQQPDLLLAGFGFILVVASVEMLWGLPRPAVGLRLPRARLILAALAAGQTERDIAMVLARTYRRVPAALVQAGDAGDFAAICRYAAWPAAHPAGLAATVARAEAAQAARWRFAGWLVYVGGPLLIGVLVAPLVIGVFQALVSLMTVPS
jgi:hypothetical protein